MINNNNEEENFYDEIKEYSIKNQGRKFEINLYDYISNKYICWNTLNKGFFCVKFHPNKKSKTYNYLNDYMNNSLDIKNYERNYFQLNMLKYLLLNQDQIKAFEKIPLYSGYETIKKQVEISSSWKLNNNFNFDFDFIEGLSDADQKLHGLFVGFN